MADDRMADQVDRPRARRVGADAVLTIERAAQKAKRALHLADGVDDDGRRMAGDRRSRRPRPSARFAAGGDLRRLALGPLPEVGQHSTQNREPLRAEEPLKPGNHLQ
jgi:hypothetical protein